MTPYKNFFTIKYYTLSEKNLFQNNKIKKNAE